MAESDRAAVRVHARGIKPGLLDYGQGLRGEGFVEFDYRDVREREAGELQRLRNGEDGANAELLGRAAGGGVGDETRERLDAECVGARLAHDPNDGCAVAHRRAVSSGNRTLGVERGL